MNGNQTRNPKSAATAGVLAVALGIFGAHNWYLNDRKKARKHVTLAIVAAVGFVLNLILRTALSSVSSLGLANFMASFATVCRIVAWFALLVDAVWALIEAVLLFVQGNDGLAEKGYRIVEKPAETENTEVTNNGTTNAATMAANVAVPAVNPAEPAPAASTNPAESAPIANTAAATPQPVGLVSISNKPAEPAPLTYNSANIQQQNQPELMGQTLATSDVETAALTVQNEAGKTRINPVILRKVLLVVGGIIIVVVGGILVKHSIDSALAVGYGDAYRLAREISPNFTEVAKSDSCQYVVDYVKSAYVDKTTYDGYVEACRKVAAEDGALIEQLGQTGAMKWDTEIATQYKDFQEKYNAALGDATKVEQMTTALDLYQAWHDYVLATDLLTVDSTDEEFQKAAEILRQSGNDTVAKYGDEWYYRELEYLQAYRAYWDLSYTHPEKENARLNAEAKRDDLRNWVEEHRPNVLTLAPFEVPNLTPAYNSFTTLYELIRNGYESHYDRKSGDCQTAGKKVYCS